MPRITYIDPETKEQRYVRPENMGDDQFQTINGWSSNTIQTLSNKGSLTKDEQKQLREQMFRTAPGDIKGLIERAEIDTLKKWAVDGGFFFSRITPQLDEQRCAPSGDQVFGQMSPEYATPKHRKYPHVLDIHRGTEPQLPSGKQWIPLLRDLIAHGQSLQKGVRDRIDLIVRRGRRVDSDPEMIFDITRADVFDSFYGFIRTAGIPHRKSGNYLTIPLLTLEQWAQSNSLVLTPDTNPPKCEVETDRRTLMNIEGKMSLDDISRQMEQMVQMIKTANTKADIKSADTSLKTFEKKIEPFRHIYDKNETRQIDEMISNIRRLIQTRTQVLQQQQQ